MRRGDLTDQQWQRLEPLLPPEKPWTGRPNEDHRQILNGILWIHRTGAPWRDLPRRYGPMGTVSSRFDRWRKAGIWQRILSDLQAEAQQPNCPRPPASAPHPPGDPDQEGPTAPAQLRPRGLPFAQPGGAADQPPQAGPAHCHPL